MGIQRLAWCVVVGTALVLSAGCSVSKIVPATQEQKSSTAATTVTPAEMGIEITALRLTAEGTMLDFRFRVLDAEKAAPLLARANKPYLIDEASGLHMQVPSPTKIGPMRQTTLKPETGRIYFALFANPGRILKRGATVSIVYGQHKLEHVTVE